MRNHEKESGWDDVFIYLIMVPIMLLFVLYGLLEILSSKVEELTVAKKIRKGEYIPEEEEPFSLC